ncbi:MAG TPA: SMC-Scp complex subunit ScpB [Thermoanaerobaculia bacterium]|nr:SMC-Scp complex subunit ScpB [Thermoanaerobaculia bacterium]
MTERSEMEAALESILFVSSEPVPRSRLVELFDEEEREEAALALAAVLARYAAGEARGVMVEDVAGGVRLVTRPEMGGWLRRFFEAGAGSKLSMAALETLAIIAYRQPITGPEIQELRSVNPVGVLKTLLEKRLVRIAGRKEVVGKPFLYATTREFLVHFGLNNLRDLPPLEEFEETFGLGAPEGGEAGAGGLAAAEPAPGSAGGDAATSAAGGAWDDAATPAAGSGEESGLPDAAEEAAPGHLARDGSERAGEQVDDREERILREAAELEEQELEEQEA